ncbi:hypothetical protein [Salipiger abyssi]|uniref:hypothetical protein n=1 Tax=Salipiger abyssi TaxID=1250539 RepID=UPI00097703DB|nr:hypothetical protein [Salipiger abyssi]
MTQAYTKAAKRRAKKAHTADLPELAQTPRREANGRKQRTDTDRDPSAAALDVRCRHAGRDATRANRRDMRAQWHGCEAGRAMASKSDSEDERRDLWDAIQHMRRTVTAHDRAIGAPSRHAVCMRLLTPTDEMSADASTPPADDRTDEDKERSATRALMILEGWLGYTDKAAATEAKRVILEDSMARDLTGFMSALRCISDGIKGKRMVWRGRG